MSSYKEIFEEFKKEYPLFFTTETIPPKKEKRKRINASNRKNSNIIRKIFEHIKVCQECGSDKMLNVHHIDKNNSNDNIENLVKLCIVCHMGKHEGENVRILMNKRYTDYKKYVYQ